MTNQEFSSTERGSREPSAGNDVASAETGGDAPARQRVAKAMARAGLCSRREAEAWVLAGRVKVNGEVLASPARDVSPSDVVTVDDAPLPSAEKTRLFLFHKPRGLVTSDYDPEGRETVTDFLRENWPEGPRVVTIGRLDINTEGLLLLTNDGGLARVLELPDTGWMRRYRVRAKGVADPAALDALAEGISIDGIDYAGIEARLDRVQGHNSWLTMGLREGKNREIKRILEHLGLEVNRLIRLSFGPFQLQDLPDGAVEEVRTRVLRDQLGPALAEQAGAFFGHEEAAQTAPAPKVAPKSAFRNASTRSSKSASKGTFESGRDGEEGKRSPTASGTRQPRFERNGSREPRPERESDSDGRRRHVTASRTMDEQRSRFGPRKRIERTDTKDRHDRTVSVERMVASSGAPRSRFGKEGSPSAQGKRARVARSSASPGRDAPREGRGETRFAERSGDSRRGSDRAERSSAGGERTFGQRRGGGDRATTRDTTSERTERPRSSKPWEAKRAPSDKPRGRPSRVFRADESGSGGDAVPARRPRPSSEGADRRDRGSGSGRFSDRNGKSPRKPSRGPRPSTPPKR